MKKSERTRRYIIEKTAPVFNVYGFHGTSLSSLQDATGLTKGSLYGNFTDKEEIAREAFLYSMSVTRSAVHKALKGKVSAREKLVALLGFYADYVFHSPVPGGCPLLNNAVEADDQHDAFKEAVALEIERTIDFIASLLDKGKKNGEFTPSTKSREVATLFFTAIEGAIMVSRVSDSARVMKIVVRHCKSILDQISLT